MSAPLLEVDATPWGATEHARLKVLLFEQGAVLIRGLNVRSAPRLEAFARGGDLPLFAAYTELPALEGRSSYGVTPYPARRWIQFHGEGAHRAVWPQRLYFCCAQPATEGGGTPVVDTRRVRERLPAAFVAEVERHGLLYRRRFLPGLDQPWQEVFATDDLAEVQQQCARRGERSFVEEGVLCMERLGQPLLAHPGRGDAVFFSQLLLHHPQLLPPDVREAAEVLFGAGRYPRDVRYGDGRAIPDAIVDEVAALHHGLSVRLAWQAGDVMVVDNLLAAHAREPFTGERRHFAVLTGASGDGDP